MIRYILGALAAALFLTAPAAANLVGPWPSRPVAGTWVIFDLDCTDLYSLDAAGLEPPAGTDPGTGGLGSTSSWNTSATPYNLQANFFAPPQVSGAADGLCDATPWTIKGNITTGASQDLWIGPLNLPPQGGYLLSDYGAIGTNWAPVIAMRAPWSTTVSVELEREGANTSLNPVVHLIGPGGDDTDAGITASEEATLPSSEPVFLVLDWNGAATWTLDMAFIPFDSFQHGRAE